MRRSGFRDDGRTRAEVDAQAQSIANTAAANAAAAALVPAVPWSFLTLQNGATSWSAAHPGDTIAGGQFMVDALGMVHLAGVLILPSRTGTALVFANLPAAARPASHFVLATIGDGAAARVDALQTGNLQLQDFGQGTTYLTLTGLHFPLNV